MNGKSVRLYRGATVRQALINAASGSSLVNQVQGGQAIVWDEGADAPTDLGGAIYAGQRLVLRPTE